MSPIPSPQRAPGSPTCPLRRALKTPGAMRPSTGGRPPLQTYKSLLPRESPSAGTATQSPEQARSRKTLGIVMSSSELSQLMNAVLPRVERYVQGIRPEVNADARVVDYKTPRELRAAMPPKALAVHDAPGTMDDVLAGVDCLLNHSVNTGHPRFWNRLYSGSEHVGQVAEFLAAVLNTSPDTYEVAPVMTLIHEEIIAEMGRRFGFQQVDGSFVPGGSYGNLTAVTVARNRRFPDMAANGILGGSGTPPTQPVMFCSAQAHYSVSRAAMVLGLGQKAGCKLVPCDSHGRMKADELRRMVNESVRSPHETPFMVVATAGTTVLGGYDPLNLIADVCQEHDLWLHVDGSWGGSVVFSNKNRPDHLAGVERANSIVFNPHKLLRAPLQCSVLVVQGRGILAGTLSSNASYLYHQHGEDDDDAPIDIGERSLQCSRKADVLKFWLMWKRYGASGFEGWLDNSFEMVQTLNRLTAERPQDFLSVTGAQCANYCFWVRPVDHAASPKCVLAKTSGTDTPTGPCPEQNCPTCKAYGDMTKAVHREITLQGKMLINYSSLPGNVPSFFRFVCGPVGNSAKDMEYIVEQLVSIRRKMAGTNGVSNGHGNGHSNGNGHANGHMNGNGNGASHATY